MPPLLTPKFLKIIEPWYLNFGFLGALKLNFGDEIG
jgi:hypothetical protein